MKKAMKEEVREKSIEPFVPVSGRFTTGSAPPSSAREVPIGDLSRAVVVAVREAPTEVMVARAIALAAALGGGQDPAEQGRALADEILGREEVKLALEIREGGAMALRRSIELAALILAAAHKEARR